MKKNSFVDSVSVSVSRILAMQAWEPEVGPENHVSIAGHGEIGL